MSSKRHHFIPKFLQRGFAIQENSKTHKVWVYKKNNQTYATNIIDSGVEGYFYGVDGDNALDDGITKFEDKYAAIIHSARTCELNTKLDKKSIAKLIYNFEFRTRNLRENFRESVQLVSQEVFNRLNSPEEYNKLLNEVVNNEIDKFVDSECQKLGIPRSLTLLCKAAFKRESRHKLEIQASMLHEQAKAALDSFESFVTDILTDTVKKAHIQAMLKAINKSSPKLKHYEQLEYSIHETRGTEIPLGDSIILFHISGNREYKSFLDDKKSLLAVLLPISHNRVICGAKKKSYMPDFAAIKLATISNSKEFFLFNKYDEQLDSLKGAISTNSHILSDDEIKELVLNWK